MVSSKINTLTLDLAKHTPQPTNAQLIDKLLYCSYMFRHYCVILRELIVSTFLSYTSMSVQWLVIQFKISHVLFCWNLNV